MDGFIRINGCLYNTRHIVRVVPDTDPVNGATLYLQGDAKVRTTMTIDQLEQLIEAATARR